MIGSTAQALSALGHASLLTTGTLLAVAGSAIAWLRGLPRRLFGALERRFVIEAEIRDDWTIFEWSLAWLATHPSMRRNRKWTVTTRAKGQRIGGNKAQLPTTEVSSSYTQEVEPVLLPGLGTYLLWFERRPVILSRMQEESKSTVPGGRARQHLTLRMVTRRRERLERMLAAIAKSAQGPEPDILRVAIADGGEWLRVDGIARRKVETVILPEGVMERMVEDLNVFLHAKDRYRFFGIPYHRGYGLFGPPGGGKTSLVQALAGHFNLTLHMLNLASVWSDEQLFSLINHLMPGSILLIEDIDAAIGPARTAEATRPAEKGPGVSLSALLNVLDGVYSKDGMITFLTSNHPEHLDPALLRDGRIDVRLDLKSPTRRQAERLFFRFFPQEHPQYAEAWAEEAIRHKKCMAQLQGELARKVFQPVVLAPPADKEFLYPAYEVRY
jgi:mitochondrial chaperone BCS1